MKRPYIDRFWFNQGDRWLGFGIDRRSRSYTIDIGLWWGRWIIYFV